MMKYLQYKLLLLMISIGCSYGNSFGYFQIVEASFCMDECSQYMLIDEDESFITFLANPNNIDIEYFINRYVEIEDGGEYQCIECSAMIINSISISNECDYPVSCFVEPCFVAEECEVNTPVDCVDNYCGGCYADFYDFDGNLVDCYPPGADECTDLYGISFGMCDMFMGYAYVNGECEGVSGIVPSGPETRPQVSPAGCPARRNRFHPWSALSHQ